VEYLDLSTEIKIFLGTWYARWLNPDRDQCASEDDSDTAYSDDDDDDDVADDSTVSDVDDGLQSDDEKEVPRGRPRVTRPLSLQWP
jgi:hypothetical protein